MCLQCLALTFPVVAIIATVVLSESDEAVFSSVVALALLSETPMKALHLSLERGLRVTSGDLCLSKAHANVKLRISEFYAPLSENLC